MKYICIVKPFDTQRFEFFHQKQKQTNSSQRVRVRVEGDGIDGDDFAINELEIRTQRVSNFLFQSFWKSVDRFIDFLFTWISIGSQVTNHISRQMDCRFRFSTLNYSGVHVFCLLTLHCSIFFILSKCCNPIGQLYRYACSKESIDFFGKKWMSTFP